MIFRKILIAGFILFSFGFLTKTPQTPPGTKKVKDHLFVDASEISNIDYREYLYWTQQVVGDSSHSWLEAQPDQTVWQQSDLKNKNYLTGHYFKNPGFDLYPVVGLTYEQALNYSKWRSDRVYEMLLIEAGEIPINPDQTKEHHFTIEAYLKGTYLNKKPNKDIYIPHYRLPTIDEWEVFAQGALNGELFPYGTKKKTHKLEKLIGEGKGPFNSLEKNSRKALTTMSKKATTETNDAVRPNKFGLYHLIGNVAEMTSEKGLAKGGSWRHSIKKTILKDTFKYAVSHNWLGFRNVCEWKTAEQINLNQ